MILCQVSLATQHVAQPPVRSRQRLHSAGPFVQDTMPAPCFKCTSCLSQVLSSGMQTQQCVNQREQQRASGCRWALGKR